MRTYIVSAMVVGAMIASFARVVSAQVGAVQPLPSQCASVKRPATPSDAERRSARDFAARAQEATITADASRARDLYQRAARLDPSDPAIAYALGRSYESANDARATGEYCRFLVLSPSAPEAQDVRARLSTLAARTMAATPASARVGVAPRTGASPGAALATGILIPGGGQYATGRAGFGLLVTAAAGGALLYALQSQTVHDSVLTHAIDANGIRYQYYTPTVRSERSHLAAGAAAAAGVSLIAAIEAYAHARGVQQDTRMRASNAADRAVAPIVTDLGGAVGMGVRVALGGW